MTTTPSAAGGGGQGAWKAFTADGKHVQDNTWHAESSTHGSSTSAPIKDARGVTIALVVARSKNYSDLPDIAPTCRLIATAPAFLAWATRQVTRRHRGCIFLEIEDVIDLENLIAAAKAATGASQ